MKKNNVFSCPNSKSLWMLIIDGKPVYRCEFGEILSDDKVKICHDGAEEFYEELKGGDIG